MRDRSRDRSAVADDWVSNHRGGIRHDVVAGGQQARPLGGLVAEERADPQGPVALLDEVEIFDLVDVDQVRWAGKPQLQQWNQALASGQHLSLVTELVEEIESLIDASRRVVLERRWQHGQPLLWRLLTQPPCFFTLCAQSGLVNKAQHCLAIDGVEGTVRGKAEGHVLGEQASMAKFVEIGRRDSGAGEQSR